MCLQSFEMYRLGDHSMSFSPPWRAVSSDDVKYDFDALVVRGKYALPTIFTFVGDRECFELPPEVNATRVDNDVWRVDLLPKRKH